MMLPPPTPWLTLGNQLPVSGKHSAGMMVHPLWATPSALAPALGMLGVQGMTNLRAKMTVQCAVSSNRNRNNVHGEHFLRLVAVDVVLLHSLQPQGTVSPPVL